MRGDEIHGGGELGMLDPHVPDFTCCNRYLDLSLRVLDQLDELVDRALAAVDSLVADDEPVHVAVLAGKIDGRTHFPRVAVLVPVDPGSDRDLKAEFFGDRANGPDAP